MGVHGTLSGHLACLHRSGLVAFIVLGLTLAWRRELELIPWIATLAVVITALALIIATRELVPLTATMLAVAAITEIAACLGHRLSLRAVPALAADFAVWLLVDVMTSAEGVPEGYHPARPLTISILCLCAARHLRRQHRSSQLRSAPTDLGFRNRTRRTCVRARGFRRYSRHARFRIRPLASCFLLPAASVLGSVVIFCR